MELEIETITPIPAANLIAHYKAIRERIWPTRPVQIKPPRRQPPPIQKNKIAPHPSSPKKYTRPLTVKNIIAEVAESHDISPHDILSHSRKIHHTKPRQIACYLAKSLTHKSLPQIGRHLGGRDHTTVLHSITKITQLMKSDEDLANTIHAIQSKFQPPPAPPNETPPMAAENQTETAKQEDPKNAS